MLTSLGDKGDCFPIFTEKNTETQRGQYKGIELINT